MTIIASLLSGILIAISFPTIIFGVQFPDLFWLAWIALVPYLLVFRTTTLRRATLLTFLLSLVCNSLTSYWIYQALHHFAGLNALEGALCVIGTGILMAVPHAAFVLIALWLGRRELVPFILLFPTSWSLYELFRNYVPFGGYPWSNLAYTQGSWLTLIQISDVLSIYGLTFFIVMVNMVVAELVIWMRRQRQFPVRPVTAIALIFGLILGYGYYRTQQIEEDMANLEHIKVGLIQPNIPQDIKWSRLEARRNLDTLLGLTHAAEKKGAEFIIWPEAAFPFAIDISEHRLGRLQEETAPILLGMIMTRERQGSMLFNSAVQVDPGGIILGPVHKQHLVPFGEYIPLKNILWFLRDMVPAAGNLTTEPSNDLLQFSGHPYGVTICYEDLFPELSRKMVQQGAQFLTNLTNDAWYGDTSQLEQHLNFSVFRAIETRRSLVRSTNTGRTAAIDPTGRIIGLLPKFIPGNLVVEIPLGGPVTLYTKYGDKLWFIFLAVLLAISVIVMNICLRWKNKTQ